MRNYFLAVALALCCVFIFPAHPAHAAFFSRVSDTISDSRLSWPSNHSIVFGVPTGVPASGKIIVSFENNAFSIDPSFSYTDVALRVSLTSPYSGFTDRPLAAVADAVDDGVAISGANGPITITLASGSAIPSGAYVRLVFGTGNYQIMNPPSTGSYRIFLNSYTSANAIIDYGTAMVAVLPAVGVDVNQYKLNPAVISNGLPTGTIPSNISGVLVSFNTDVFSICHYATSSGLTYDAMANVAASTADGLFHTVSVSGITRGTTYAYYVRCKDFAGNKNTDDYVISFTAGDPTGTGLGGGTSGEPAAPPGTPSGGGGGGGGAPFPPAPSIPSLVMKGLGVPGASIAVLEDGKTLPSAATTIDSSGNFSINIASVPQGTYSFTVMEKGSSGSSVASYTATLTIIAGTTNSISNILLPPTISFVTSTVALGATAPITGFAPPSSTVEIWVTSQSSAQNPIKKSMSADGSGKWAYALATKELTSDTYQIKARATLPQYTASNFSAIAYLGVGTAVQPKNRGDLNGDGKVNLVDFSVLLFHWGQNYPPADLNGDGSVNLADFSILLFNWTG